MPTSYSFNHIHVCPDCGSEVNIACKGWIEGRGDDRYFTLERAINENTDKPFIPSEQEKVDIEMEGSTRILEVDEIPDYPDPPNDELVREARQDKGMSDIGAMLFEQAKSINQVYLAGMKQGGGR